MGDILNILDPATGKYIAVPGLKGSDGVTPHIGTNGNWYVGEADTGVKARGDKGEKGDSGSVPPFAQTVADCTDTSKMYLLPDGYLYAYITGTSIQEITEQIVGTSDNPFKEGCRLSSSGADSTDAGEAVTTPYIDIGKYEQYGTIKLRFGGVPYIPTAQGTYNRFAQYDANKANVLTTDSYQAIGGTGSGWGPVERDGDGAAIVTWTLPRAYNGQTVKYIRVCAIGTEADSDISVTYTGEVTGAQWVNTGLKYSPTLTAEEKTEIAQQAADMIDTQLLAVIGEGSVTV